jgi:hypothetical protein
MEEAEDRIFLSRPFKFVKQVLSDADIRILRQIQLRLYHRQFNVMSYLSSRYQDHVVPEVIAADVLLFIGGDTLCRESNMTLNEWAAVLVLHVQWDKTLRELSRYGFLMNKRNDKDKAFFSLIEAVSSLYPIINRDGTKTCRPQRDNFNDRDDDNATDVPELTKAIGNRIAHMNGHVTGVVRITSVDMYFSTKAGTIGRTTITNDQITPGLNALIESCDASSFLSTDRFATNFDIHKTDIIDRVSAFHDPRLKTSNLRYVLHGLQVHNKNTKIYKEHGGEVVLYLAVGLPVPLTEQGVVWVACKPRNTYEIERVTHQVMLIYYVYDNSFISNKSREISDVIVPPTLTTAFACVPDNPAYAILGYRCMHEYIQKICDDPKKHRLSQQELSSLLMGVDQEMHSAAIASGMSVHVCVEEERQRYMYQDGHSICLYLDADVIRGQDIRPGSPYQRTDQLTYMSTFTDFILVRKIAWLNKSTDETCYIAKFLEREGSESRLTRARLRLVILMIK